MVKLDQINEEIVAVYRKYGLIAIKDDDDKTRDSPRQVLQSYNRSMIYDFCHKHKIINSDQVVRDLENIHDTEELTQKLEAKKPSIEEVVEQILQHIHIDGKRINRDEFTKYGVTRSEDRQWAELIKPFQKSFKFRCNLYDGERALTYLFDLVYGIELTRQDFMDSIEKMEHHLIGEVVPQSVELKGFVFKKYKNGNWELRSEKYSLMKIFEFFKVHGSTNSYYHFGFYDLD